VVVGSGLEVKTTRLAFKINVKAQCSFRTVIAIQAIQQMLSSCETIIV